MTSPVNNKLLESLSGLNETDGEKAFDACAPFGALAPWFVDRRLRAAAHKHNPDSPHITSPAEPQVRGVLETVGACSPLGAWPAAGGRTRTTDGYNRGFVLPLAWCEQESEAPPDLPDDFVREAEFVKTVMLAQPELGGDHKRWQLRLHPAVRSAGPVSLAGLTMKPESAWVALAAGLYLAVHNAKPNPEVMATGVWNGAGAAKVEGLEYKLRAASRHGARAVFVPDQQVNAARDRAQADGLALTIGTVRQGTRNPVEALRDYLVALEAPPPRLNPGDAETFEKCRDYFQHVRGSEQAGRYYRATMLPFITARAKGRINWPGGRQRCTHLVTFLSGSPELVLLMSAVMSGYGLTKVLVLNPTGRAAPEWFAQEVAQKSGTLEYEPIRDVPSDELGAAIRAAVTHFFHGVPPEHAVLDITPGTARMKWIADRAMPGSYRVALESEYRDNLPVPGTETPVVWRA